MQKSGRNEELREVFNAAYAALNSAQKEAVDTIEGPVMVIAGPGTGKTQILTLRIANILLKTDTKPENILALTFTESGASAMRERLRKYIGAEAYRVAIYTFHGFAEHLIGRYPEAYPNIIGGRAASDLDKVALIENILDSKDIKVLRPIGNTSYYISPIIRILGELKKEYVSPDILAQMIAGQERELLGIEQIHQKGAHKGKVRSEYTKQEKTIEKNKELLLVYRQYQALLRDQNLYDFEDMIIETVAALEHNQEMLRDLQETYQYVLADEHQDVNGSQNRILELVCSFHDSPNIFVVGDEKQAIYRFQGASLENFLYFEDTFKNTKTIALISNYRSGQVILDAAHHLVKVEEGPLVELRVPLTAAIVQSAHIERRTFTHQGIEDSWVVEAVHAELERGTEPQEIAIIVRTNKEVEQYAALLRKEHIPVEASADGDILDHPITNAIASIIDATVNSHNDEALFALLHGAYWNIAMSDLVRIYRARSYAQSLHTIISNRELLTELGVEHIEEVLNVDDTLTQARAKEITEAPHRVLEFILQKSGFLDHVLTMDPIEGSRVVRRIYDEVESLVLQKKAATLRDISTLFALRREHRLPLNAPYIAGSSQAVQVVTAHKSKGREYEAVFVPHAVDSVWGGAAKRTYFDVPFASRLKNMEFDAIDDERRLLYVAMTRAKHRLLLSSSETSIEGKVLIASRFFEDMSDQLQQIQTNTSVEDFDPLEQLQETLESQEVTALLFESHLREKGLSATALNNYLRSPWDYLYRNVLRIPEVQALPMQFGTAVHGVMEWVTAVYAQNKKMPSITEIKAQLETELSRLPLTDTEFAHLHEKGFQALCTYINFIAGTLPPQSQVEFSMHVELKTDIPALPLLKLTGKLDRLDFDAQGNVALVVDYKTGKPKTRNDIEGKTQSSNGDYKRQLVFYALLLSLYGDERYACKSGMLSFIEPDAKGKIHEEVFVITDEEIDELKQELKRVAAEIVSGSFLKTPCDPAVSNYCHLAHMLI